MQQQPRQDQTGASKGEVTITAVFKPPDRDRFEAHVTETSLWMRFERLSESWTP